MPEKLYLEVDKTTGAIVSACTEIRKDSSLELVECTRNEFSYLDALSDIRTVTLSDLNDFRSALNKPKAKPTTKQTTQAQQSTKTKPKKKLTTKQFLAGFNKPIK